MFKISFQDIKDVISSSSSDKNNLLEIRDELASLFSSIEVNTEILRSYETSVSNNFSQIREDLQEKGYSESDIDDIIEEFSNGFAEIKGLKDKFNKLSDKFENRDSIDRREAETLISYTEKTAKILEKLPKNIALKISLDDIFKKQAEFLSSDLPKEVRRQALIEIISYLKTSSDTDKETIKFMKDISDNTEISDRDFNAVSNKLIEISNDKDNNTSISVKELTNRFDHSTKTSEQIKDILDKQNTKFGSSIKEAFLSKSSEISTATLTKGLGQGLMGAFGPIGIIADQMFGISDRLSSVGDVVTNKLLDSSKSLLSNIASKAKDKIGLGSKESETSDVSKSNIVDSSKSLLSNVVSETKSKLGLDSKESTSDISESKSLLSSIASKTKSVLGLDSKETIRDNTKFDTSNIAESNTIDSSKSLLTNTADRTSDKSELISKESISESAKSLLSSVANKAKSKLGLDSKESTRDIPESKSLLSSIASKTKNVLGLDNKEITSDVSKSNIIDSSKSLLSNVVIETKDKVGLNSNFDYSNPVNKSNEINQIINDENSVLSQKLISNTESIEDLTNIIKKENRRDRVLDKKDRKRDIEQHEELIENVDDLERLSKKNLKATKGIDVEGGGGFFSSFLGNILGNSKIGKLISKVPGGKTATKLLSKIPGVGKLLGGAAEGVLGTAAEGALGAGAEGLAGGGLLSTVGGLALPALAVTAAGAAGYGIGTLITKTTGSDKLGGKIYDLIHGKEDKNAGLATDSSIQKYAATELSPAAADKYLKEFKVGGPTFDDMVADGKLVYDSATSKYYLPDEINTESKIADIASKAQNPSVPSKSPTSSKPSNIETANKSSSTTNTDISNNSSISNTNTSSESPEVTNTEISSESSPIPSSAPLASTEASSSNITSIDSSVNNFKSSSMSKEVSPDTYTNIQKELVKAKTVEVKHVPNNANLRPASMPHAATKTPAPSPIVMDDLGLIMVNSGLF